MDILESKVSVRVTDFYPPVAESQQLNVLRSSPVGYLKTMSNHEQSQNSAPFFIMRHLDFHPTIVSLQQYSDSLP